MHKRTSYAFTLLAILALIVFSSCAPGDERFTGDNPAGFLAGLWHGAIGVVTFVIGLFSDSVRFYEPQNAGSLYDFGFILGVLCVWGGGTGSIVKGKRASQERVADAEWEEIGSRVEEKVLTKLKHWVEAEEGADSEEVERKLKRKIKKWLDEE